MQHLISVEKQKQLDEKKKLIAHMELKLMYGGVIEIEGMYFGKYPCQSTLMDETYALLEITKPIKQRYNSNSHQRVF